MGISTQQDLENAGLANSVFPEPKTKSALQNMIFFSMISHTSTYFSKMSGQLTGLNILPFLILKSIYIVKANYREILLI